MSNFLAIATVTATLRQALETTIGPDVPGATVTMARPDGTGTGTPTTGVNLYLYQVTPNTAWRNADLPTRRLNGQLLQRPKVALDLHYLLNFYGDEAQLEPQRLLGSVVRTLHAQPVLTRQMIQSTVADGTFNFLAPSNLADEIEQVKFTSLPLSLEELSKLWSVFFQTPYTLSVAYQANVVLIESEDTPQPTLPVRERNLYVVPSRQPVVEQVLSEAGENEFIMTTSVMLIRGRQLRGEDTRVLIGGIEVIPAPEEVSDTQIRIISLPSDLQAGVQGVQIVHQMLMGTPPTPHRGVESNVTAFVLHPSITAVSVSNVQGAGNEPRSADVTIQITPMVGNTQRMVLLLNERLSDTPAVYSFIIPSRGADANSITVSINTVKAAEYLVRVQVDGSESPLDLDANGAYSGPTVTIP